MCLPSIRTSLLSTDSILTASCMHGFLVQEKMLSSYDQQLLSEGPDGIEASSGGNSNSATPSAPASYAASQPPNAQAPQPYAPQYAMPPAYATTQMYAQPGYNSQPAYPPQAPAYPTAPQQPTYASQSAYPYPAQQLSEPPTQPSYAPEINTGYPYGAPPQGAYPYRAQMAYGGGYAYGYGAQPNPYAYPPQPAYAPPGEYANAGQAPQPPYQPYAQPQPAYALNAQQQLSNPQAMYVPQQQLQTNVVQPNKALVAPPQDALTGSPKYGGTAAAAMSTKSELSARSSSGSKPGVDGGDKLWQMFTAPSSTFDTKSSGKGGGMSSDSSGETSYAWFMQLVLSHMLFVCVCVSKKCLCAYNICLSWQPCHVIVAGACMHTAVCLARCQKSAEPWLEKVRDRNAAACMTEGVRAESCLPLRTLIST
jgi:hypothetical protein